MKLCLQFLVDICFVFGVIKVAIKHFRYLVVVYLLPTTVGTSLIYTVLNVVINSYIFTVSFMASSCII